MIFIQYLDHSIVAGEADDVTKLRKHLNAFFPTKNLDGLAHKNGDLLSRCWQRGPLEILQSATICRCLDCLETTSSSPLPACSSPLLEARGPEETKL